MSTEAERCIAEPMLLMSVLLDNLYSNAVHYGAESGNICIRSRSQAPRFISMWLIAANRFRKPKEK